MIFLKTQATLIAGSLADYLVTIVLVQLFHCWYLSANLAGNICGFVFQFILCRGWVFNMANHKLFPQAIKFVLVVIGSLLLSAAGVYLFTHTFHLNYIVAKIITSLLLGVSYNYVLLNKFVFNQTRKDAERKL